MSSRIDDEIVEKYQEYEAVSGYAVSCAHAIEL
jgi:hypothetical protein